MPVRVTGPLGLVPRVKERVKEASEMVNESCDVEGAAEAGIFYKDMQGF